MPPPSAPDAPDMTAVANKQSGANIDAAVQGQSGSMVNQTNPYGSLKYKQTGTKNGVPQYTATQTLTPEQQKIFDIFQGTQQTAGQQGQNLLTNANYGDVPDFSTGTDSRVSQRMGQMRDYLDPYFQQQQEQSDAKLSNMGLDINSEAYQKADRNLKDTQNQSVQKYLTDIQPEAFNQSVTEYGLPLAMSQQLASMGKPVGDVKGGLIDTPGLQVNPANYIGAASTGFNQQMESYNAKKAQWDAMASGVTGLAGAAAGMPFMQTGGTNFLNGFMDRGMGSWAPT